MVSEVEKIILQSEYTALLEQRTAFKNADMTAKVEEWDYKIKVCEASMVFSKTSFEIMGEQLGIAGLNEAIGKRKALFSEKIIQAKLLALDVVQDYLDKSFISESKLWEVIGHYRLKGNIVAMVEALKLLTDKTKGSVTIMLKEVIKAKENERETEIEIPEDLQAYIKVVEIHEYSANDNPPMEVLTRTISAKELEIFDTMYVAYPMIGRVKQIDPIIFGVIKNPNESNYYSLKNLETFWLNGDTPFEFLKNLNIGNMFHIADWV